MNTDWALQVNKMLVRVSQNKMGFTSVFNGSHKATSKWKQQFTLVICTKNKGNVRRKYKYVCLNTRKAADENKVSHQ